MARAKAKHAGGRPLLGDKGRTKVLTIKVSADERRAWEAQAAAEQRTLSEWIRARCNR